MSVLKTVKIVFREIPESFDQFTGLPQAAMKTPFDTAALTVLALCVYPKSKELSIQMLEYLRGPRPMNGMEKQFLADRFRGKEYIARSYLSGAVPENDYQPSVPCTVEVSENAYSYQESGYVKLMIPCGGADSPRPVKLRQAKDGKWYLWEHALLTGIREPESSNPW